MGEKGAFQTEGTACIKDTGVTNLACPRKSRKTSVAGG